MLYFICKCFNCGNRPPRNNDVSNQSSCHCGANKRNGGEEVKRCTETIGKRRIKCKCYKEMRPCTNKCSCYVCSLNEYGRREASNALFLQKRNIKCTSSPSSLQRKRTDKFLTENDFEVKAGSWTTDWGDMLIWSRSTFIFEFNQHSAVGWHHNKYV